MTPPVPASVPRVSVAMATYNYGQYIGQAIQSVLDQTYGDWELIIIDDGSTDDTELVVQTFLGDSRVRFYRCEHRGSAHSKNRAIELARGRLLAFLDADDAWLSTKLARQVQLFDADPELGVAYTGASLMDEQGTVIGSMQLKMVRGAVLEEAVKRTIPPFSSSMVRREVFNRVGRFDESLELAIDYDLWLRVALEFRFDYVDDPLLLYRTGHANLSRRVVERRNLVLQRIMPAFFARSDVQARLRHRAIAEAYADTYINQAWSLRPTSLGKALLCHVRALAWAPWMPEAWWNALRCVLPDRLVSSVKRLIPRRGVREDRPI